MRKLLTCICLGALAGALSGQELERNAPPEVDEALRARVISFYQFFQQGKFRQAEEFVDEDSKDLFYGAKKNRIIGFSLQTIGYADDFRQADVLVTCQAIVPMLGSAPLSIPLGSEWRYHDDEGWLMHLVERKTKGVDPSVQSPFGGMVFSQTLPEPGQMRAAPAAPAMAVTLEQLKNMFEISDEEVSFSSSDEVQTRTITVRNLAQGRIEVERYGGKTSAVEIKIEPEAIEPGGEATISFTYDPTVKKLSGRYRVDFMIVPLNHVVPVVLSF